MANSGDDEPSNSAPDLQILGDQVTLQPSGYLQTARDDEKEEALMRHMASFRFEPLQCVFLPHALLPEALLAQYTTVIG